MSEEPYHERDEKEVRKREETGGEEKSWEEKWRRHPLNAAAWAIIIIWVGLVLLGDNLGLLARFERLDNAWGLIFIGAGLILLLEILVRIVIPDYRRPLTGTLILAVVFLGIGLGDLFDWRVTGALVLIAVGVGILLQGFLRRR